MKYFKKRNVVYHCANDDKKFIEDLKAQGFEEIKRGKQVEDEVSEEVETEAGSNGEQNG